MSTFSVSSIASTTNAYLYEKLYRLAEKIYYIEYSLNDNQKKSAEELSNQIDLIISLPNDVTCGNKLDVYKEAYNWCYSTGGMNETSSEAEKFANMVTSQICPGAFFNVFKPAYSFAYTRQGMDKTRSESKKFAATMSEYEASKYYIKKSLQCYMENYIYAYSSGGLNKTRSESEKFAEKQCLG